MKRRERSQSDLYARGWEQGMREARRLVLRHQDDPLAAVAEIEAMVVRSRAILAQAERAGTPIPDGDRLLP